MKKNRILLILAAVLSLFVLTTAAVAEEETETEEYVRSRLTGELVPAEIGNSRPIAVMLNNIYDAVPQYGISKADVIVEAEVEGLITRFMGIFEDYEDCGRIGSIRSARNYYYYFAREFQAIYCHWGEAAYALPLLRLDSTLELDGQTSSVGFFRSDDRVSPHNGFTDYSHIRAGIEEQGIDDQLPESYTRHFLFAEDGEEIVPDGIVARVVMPGYTYNHARFDYNSEDGLYYRSQFYDAQVDGDTGEQLAYKNIILQYCDSTAFDDNGYLWTDVVSGGTGKYITNGRCIDITWSKPQAQEDTTFIVNIEAPNITVPVYTGDFEVTHYYDTDGNEITLNQGNTWICLIRNSAADSVLITDNASVSTDIIDSM